LGGFEGIWALEFEGFWDLREYGQQQGEEGSPDAFLVKICP